ncbi:MAG: GNAT family N-acetyltransferase [Paracoccaceae bacterium]
MGVYVQDASVEDEAAWRGLWRSYLTFYEQKLDPAITDLTWVRILDPGHRIGCRMAFDGDAALGFAIHHAHCSTWAVADDVYLEDLFVSPAARGQGVGRALIEDLMALGRANGWHQLYWHTKRDNVVARRLYDTFGNEDGNVRYRLTL